MTPRGTLRRPGQERRSGAPPTPSPSPAPGAPLVLYHCPPFAAWISVNACVALKLREKPPPGASRVPENVTAEGPVFAGLRALGRRLSPCLACPGVVALRERRKTPKPRRIET